jgi:hypothetical protein
VFVVAGVAVVRHAHRVFDVGGFEEVQPTELDESDAAGRQFDLEQVAVVGGAHQYGLIAQPLPVLGAREDRTDALWLPT